MDNADKIRRGDTNYISSVFTIPPNENAFATTYGSTSHHKSKGQRLE